MHVSMCVCTHHKKEVFYTLDAYIHVSVCVHVKDKRKHATCDVCFHVHVHAIDKKKSFECSNYNIYKVHLLEN